MRARATAGDRRLAVALPEPEEATSTRTAQRDARCSVAMPEAAEHKSMLLHIWRMYEANEAKRDWEAAVGAAMT